MPVTSLKLSDDLKKRIDTLVKKDDRTAHAFMVEAISQAIEREELRQGFLADARRAERELLNGGKVYDLDQVFDYLEAKGKDSKSKRPREKSWQRSG